MALPQQPVEAPGARSQKREGKGSSSGGKNGCVQRGLDAGPDGQRVEVRIVARCSDVFEWAEMALFFLLLENYWSPQAAGSRWETYRRALCSPDALVASERSDSTLSPRETRAQTSGSEIKLAIPGPSERSI